MPARLISPRPGWRAGTPALLFRDERDDERRFVPDSGVSKKASAEEIKKAYKKLARKYHPDLNPGDKKAEEQFKKLTGAYTILSDPQKRAQYDQFGTVLGEGQQAPPGAGGVNFDFEGFDFSNPGGNSFSDIFSDLFGAFRGGGGGGGRKPGRDRPLRRNRKKAKISCTRSTSVSWMRSAASRGNPVDQECRLPGVQRARNRSESQPQSLHRL